LPIVPSQIALHIISNGIGAPPKSSKSADTAIILVSTHIKQTRGDGLMNQAINAAGLHRPCDHPAVHADLAAALKALAFEHGQRAIVQEGACDRAPSAPLRK